MSLNKISNSKGFKILKTVKDNIMSEIVKRISTWLTAIIFSVSYLYYDQLISLVCQKAEDKLSYSVYNFNNALKKVEYEILNWSEKCGENCLVVQTAIVPSYNADYVGSILSVQSINKTFKPIEFKDPIFLGDLTSLLDQLKHSPSKCNLFDLRNLPEREISKLLNKLNWRSNNVLICVLPKDDHLPKILLFTFISHKNYLYCGSCVQEMHAFSQKIDEIWKKSQKN